MFFKAFWGYAYMCCSLFICSPGKNKKSHRIHFVGAINRINGLAVKIPNCFLSYCWNILFSHSVKCGIKWQKCRLWLKFSMMDMLWRIWHRTPYIDVIKIGQVMVITHHPLKLRSMLAVNQFNQRQMTCSSHQHRL